MNFSKRSYKKEILDQEDLPFEDIKKNMEELNFINTWLGGHKVSIQGLKSLVGTSREIVVCEIGCGGGDNINALDKWCTQKGIQAKFIGVDIKDECIQFAKSKTTSSNKSWITSDYRLLNLDDKPDVIFSSLFCHHFTDPELVEQLDWMRNSSKKGFFINDLQRHPLAYYSIKFLTSLFSSSYLVKNDAPLSVTRGFKKDEWQSILGKAGVRNALIKWMWAFRYLIICKHE